MAGAGKPSLQGDLPAPGIAKPRSMLQADSLIAGHKGKKTKRGSEELNRVGKEKS